MYSSVPYPNYLQNTGKPSSNVLQVLGESSIFVQPNQAMVTLGVITEDIQLEVAQQANTSITSTIISGLEQLSVSRKHIQTTTFQIIPNYDYQDGKQIFRGYRITHLLTITVTPITKLGRIIDTAIKNGANTVNRIDMTIDDPLPYQQQALTKAIQQSQIKAITIGKALGVQIQTIPFHMEELKSKEERFPQNYALAAITEAQTTPIEAGRIEVKARIMAKFRY